MIRPQLVYQPQRRPGGAPHKRGWIVRWPLDQWIVVDDDKGGWIPDSIVARALAVARTRSGGRHLFFAAGAVSDCYGDPAYRALALVRGCWDEFPIAPSAIEVCAPEGAIYYAAHAAACAIGRANP